MTPLKLCDWSQFTKVNWLHWSHLTSFKSHNDLNFIEVQCFKWCPIDICSHWSHISDPNEVTWPHWKNNTLKKRRRSFCFGAPTVWNCLNSKTREADSLGSFKTRLKIELFSSAFQWSTCSSPTPPWHQNHPRTIYFFCSWTKLCK